MCERQKLLHQIRVYRFAVLEVSLYLDSHPTCQPALSYYHRHLKKLNDAVASYEQQYGPLTMTQNTNTDRWAWVDGPWPWELEA